MVDPATGQRVTQWNQNTQLTPALQAALDDQQAITRGRSGIALGLLDRAGEEFGPMMDWSQFQQSRGAPDVPDYDTSNLYQIGDPNRYRQQAEDATYNRYTSRLDPQFADREQALDVKLRNQGLVPGTEAYDKAMRNESFARNDAYAGARDAAVLAGRGEAESMFGMDTKRREQMLGEMLRTGSQGFQQGVQAAGFDNTVRQQQIAEEMQRRGFSLNEINAILTGQQVAMPTMPGFNTAQRSETPQYMTAAQNGYQANLDSFNAEQQAFQGIMSGATGLGSAWLTGGMA